MGEAGRGEAKQVLYKQKPFTYPVYRLLRLFLPSARSQDDHAGPPSSWAVRKNCVAYIYFLRNRVSLVRIECVRPFLKLNYLKISYNFKNNLEPQWTVYKYFFSHQGVIL